MFGCRRITIVIAIIMVDILVVLKNKKNIQYDKFRQ